MTPQAIRIRAALEKCTAELGLPEGYGPSIPKYKAWAARHPAPSLYQLQKWAGFARWNDTLRYAGLKPYTDLFRPRQTRRGGALPDMTRKEARLAMIADLRRVSRLLGKPGRVPSWKHYRKLGRFSRCQVLDLLGGEERTWHEVAASANLLCHRVRNGWWTEDRVVAEYRRVAKLCGMEPGGYGPSEDDIERYGAHSKSLYWRLGTFNALVVAAGFQPRPAMREEQRRAA
jgi:hypothetical protein